jgi:predicted metal-dependent hydrolase
MPDDARLTPAEAVQLAQQLIDQGRPFHAHEVLEAVWKSSLGAQRDLWQGLAQIAVGLTHARRGNGRGAVTLLRRGAAAVGRYAPAADEPGELPAALDLAGVHAAAAGLADAIAARGLGAMTEDDLRLQLGTPATG